MQTTSSSTLLPTLLNDLMCFLNSGLAENVISNWAPSHIYENSSFLGDPPGMHDMSVPVTFHSFFCPFNLSFVAKVSVINLEKYGGNYFWFPTSCDQEARENKMSPLEEGLMSPIFGYNVANSWISSTLEKNQEEQGWEGMRGSSKPPGWSGESNNGFMYIPQDGSLLPCLGNYHEKHNYTREITNPRSSCVPWDVSGEEW